MIQLRVHLPQPCFEIIIISYFPLLVRLLLSIHSITMPGGRPPKSKGRGHSKRSNCSTKCARTNKHKVAANAVAVGGTEAAAAASSLSVAAAAVKPPPPPAASKQTRRKVTFSKAVADHTGTIRANASNSTTTTQSSLKRKAPPKNEETTTMHDRLEHLLEIVVADGWKPDEIRRYIMHSLPLKEEEKEQLLTTAIASSALVEAMIEIEDDEEEDATSTSTVATDAEATTTSTTTRATTTPTTPTIPTTLLLVSVGYKTQFWRQQSIHQSF